MHVVHMGMTSDLGGKHTVQDLQKGFSGKAGEGMRGKAVNAEDKLDWLIRTNRPVARGSTLWPKAWRTMNETNIGERQQVAFSTHR